ncbi:hypothetical protein HMPREF9445_01126 [Bacteroides clarus YIT 12056]|uniref:Uncharacterized protein n=1 Tax=Bacteroides clarus YIT 12056 TaxID=762984 RepID=A0ABN0CPL5_9BACE|nr:hypothetical protein HMPREF9445_01126 [Bacteroides clarus YIT 12056]
MDIAVEAMDGTKVFGHTHQPFHCIIGVAHHTATQKKPFDVVAAIKFHCQIHQFADGKGGTRQVVATTVDTIGAIVYAVIRQHHFQQRNTASVLCKAMTDTPPAHSITHHARFIGTHSTAG